jgi:hypothetical protein
MMSFSTPLWSDFEHYKPATLDQIIEITDDYYRKHGRRGVTTRLDGVRLRIRIQNFPVEISEGGSNMVKWFFHFTPAMDKNHIPLYTHEMHHVYKGKNFCFMFQRELVAPLRRENSIGSTITVFAIFGIYNSFDHEHTLLVNGFVSDAPKEPDAASVEIGAGVELRDAGGTMIGSAFSMMR